MNEDDDLAKDLVNTATRKRNAEIIWSVSPGSTSKSHGGFDDDPATMNNVLARILALSNQQLQSEFKESTEADDPFVVKFKRCLDDLGKTRDLDVFEFRPAPPPLPCGCDGHGAPPASAVAAHHAASAHGGGASHARRALCIGIDRYPVSPLGGCVADARTWSAALSSAGFETSLLLDGDATRSRILTAIERLISGSGSGDVLVLQYSGHGTTLPDRNADETEDPNDQAVCPVDFPQGHFLVDDDIAKLFERIPHGVNLTCFFDCCHSGSITRFAIGAAPVPRGAGTRRARFVRATPEMIQAHESFRARNGPEAPRGAAMVSRGPATMREVVYSACRRDEVAYENDGQGDFTRLAVPLLQRAGASLTNLQFRELVKKAFGENPAQHPLLDCAPRSENLAFLSSAMSGASPSREFSVSPSARSAPSGGGDARTDAVARLLRDVANLLDT